MSALLDIPFAQQYEIKQLYGNFVFKELTKAYKAKGDKTLYLESAAKCALSPISDINDCKEFYVALLEESDQQERWSDNQDIAKYRELFNALDLRNAKSLNYKGKSLDAPSAKIFAVAIAHALETNTSLTSLDIGRNNIGPAGGQAIAKALETNTSLTSLNIGGNNIGPAGGQALAKALETNTSLNSLDISINTIGPAGGQALAKALETNTGLTSLDIMGNNIDPAGWQALAKALETNTSITSLNIGSNDIGPALEVQINAKVNHNKAAVLEAIEYNTLAEDIKSEALEKKFLKFAPKLLKLKGSTTTEEIAQILNMNGDTSHNVSVFEADKALLRKIQSVELGDGSDAVPEAFLKSHPEYKGLISPLLGESTQEAPGDGDLDPMG